MSTSSRRLLAHGLIPLCLAMLLTACQSAPIVKTQTVTVRVPVPVRLDPALTKQEPKPPRPAAKCRDDKGPILCNGQMVDWLRAYDAAANRSNARFRAIDGLQPKVKP